MRFEYWQSAANGNWYWHLRSSNNLVIAQGEGYTNKSDCLHVIDLIKNYAASAPAVAI